jgi:DNA-directed RNA polymerase specialized sigma24 family protein
MEGLSTRDGAKVMGVSEDNVKTRMHRARIRLHAALNEGNCECAAATVCSTCNTVACGM